MASSFSYVFDSLSRIGDDNCAIGEREVQNQNFGSYPLKSYFESECGMRKPIDFSTKQPNIFAHSTTTGSNVGLGGCNVQSDTELRHGSLQTGAKARISLQTRPFLTVPFLGRGPSKPVMESQLQQGSFSFDKKSCKNVMEKSYGVTNVDLVPSLKATIQNPANLIEDAAADGWIRGGLPSRELSRDNDYFKRR